MVKDNDYEGIAFRNVLLKLYNEKILNERRGNSVVYSLDLENPKKVKQNIIEYMTSWGYSGTNKIGRANKSDIELSDVPAVSLDGKFNITLKQRRTHEPQRAPLLSTELVGAWFPVGRNGNVYLDFKSLDLRSDDRVPKKHISKIRKIEKEFKEKGLDEDIHATFRKIWKENPDFLKYLC